MATADPPSTAKPDALAILIRDHNEVDQLFERFDRADDDEAVGIKGDLLGQITQALSVHAAVEEEIVYPVMRTALPDGNALVRKALADHQKVQEEVAALETMAPLEPEVLPAVHALAKDVRAHVAEEEADLFPRLAAAVDEATLQDMGRAIEKARRSAPTAEVKGLVDRVRGVLDDAADKGRALFESRGKQRP